LLSDPTVSFNILYRYTATCFGSYASGCHQLDKEPNYKLRASLYVHSVDTLTAQTSLHYVIKGTFTFYIIFYHLITLQMALMYVSYVWPWGFQFRVRCDRRQLSLRLDIFIRRGCPNFKKYKNSTKCRCNQMLNVFGINWPTKYFCLLMYH